MIKFVSDATNRWFSSGPPVSSINKIDRHDIAEILLKVALIAINQTNKQTNKQTDTRTFHRGCVVLDTEKYI